MDKYLNLAICMFDEDASTTQIVNKMEKSVKKSSKKVILDEEGYTRLRELISSPDDKNKVVAFGVLNSLNVKDSMPYMLLLYKEFRDGNDWETIIKKMGNALSGISTEKILKMDWNFIVDTTEKHYPDALPAVISHFEIALNGHLVQWGFTFIKKKYSVKLVDYVK